jgi:tRNA threonylcarbamoyladenosine biosynthesis protein TsaE
VTTVLDVVEAQPEHAADVATVVYRSFAARPPLDPPAAALDEDADSIREAIAADGGLVAEFDGRVVGALLFDHSLPNRLGLRRVAVNPGNQAHGVASAMVGVAEALADARGFDGLWLRMREELPDTVRFWLRRGYQRTGEDGVHTVVGKSLPATAAAGSPAAMHGLAARLAGLLRAGDVLILTGELGAGKTTFVQGLGDALGVRGPVTSPTFVLSRVHPSLINGPTLVHVDAYRLNSAAEVDDLDLDATVATGVTAIEWGHGVAEQLSDSWLDVSIETAAVTDGAEPARQVVITPHGPRWADIALRSSLSEARA